MVEAAAVRPSADVKQREFCMSTTTAEEVDRPAESVSNDLSAPGIRIDAPHHLGDAPEAP